MKWYDIIFIIVSLIIIILSLLQGGKSEGSTGGGLNVFAKTKERGSEKVVTYLTFAFAILFLTLALIVMLLNGAGADASSSTSSVAA